MALFRLYSPRIPSRLLALASVVALGAAAAVSQAATLTVNLNDVESRKGFGSSSNEVFSYFIGANAHVTGFAYDVTITAFDPSYLSEANVYYTDSAISDGVYTRPGFGVDDPGTQSFSVDNDLVDSGLDFNVGADGILRLEFAESYDDFDVDPDAVWNGTLTITHDGVEAVPEPASMAALGLGGLALLRRRRKSA